MQTVGHSKVMLEKELQEVIALTSQELEEYREKVLELEDEVGKLMITRQSGQATPLPLQLWSRETGPWSIRAGPVCLTCQLSLCTLFSASLDL